MSTTDDIKAAELRGYRRGYSAGRRRKARDVSMARREAEREAFTRRAFLAALPEAIRCQGWTMDGRAVKTLPERVELAWRFAREAAKGVR